MIACHSRQSADCIDKAWQVSNSRVTGLGCSPGENSTGPITRQLLTLTRTQARTRVHISQLQMILPAPFIPFIISPVSPFSSGLPLPSSDPRLSLLLCYTVTAVLAYVLCVCMQVIACMSECVRACAYKRMCVCAFMPLCVCV